MHQVAVHILRYLYLFYRTSVLSCAGIGVDAHGLFFCNTTSVQIYCEIVKFGLLDAATSFTNFRIRNLLNIWMCPLIT